MEICNQKLDPLKSQLARKDLGGHPLTFSDEWNLAPSNVHNAGVLRNGNMESDKSGDENSPDNAEESPPTQILAESPNPMQKAADVKKTREDVEAKKAEDSERKRKEREAKKKEDKKLEATDDQESARAFIKSVESYVSCKADDRERLEQPRKSAASMAPSTHGPPSLDPSRLLVLPV